MGEIPDIYIAFPMYSITMYSCDQTSKIATIANCINHLFSLTCQP